MIAGKRFERALNLTNELYTARSKVLHNHGGYWLGWLKNLGGRLDEMSDRQKQKDFLDLDNKPYNKAMSMLCAQPSYS